MQDCRLFVLPVVFAVLLFSMTGGAFASTITFETLLDEMVDRSAVAEFPSRNAMYTCKQVSSYDRHSVAPGRPGWFANVDNSVFLRSERNAGRKEWVMMDSRGPGAMVRWWVTHKNNDGTLRIYLDGSTKPVVEAKIDDLFGGKTLVGPPLSAIREGGRNLYLPIPYARCCKVTYEGKNYEETRDVKDRFYYQINYRTYRPDARVASFTRSTVTDSRVKIAEVQKRLRDREPDLNLPVEKSENFRREFKTRVDCVPGKSVSLAHFKAMGAVCEISIKVDAEDIEQAIRSTVLRAKFDGCQTIWCPMGDFFGCGVGINPFEDWYRRVRKDGTMTCRWVMPYEKSCEIFAENTGKDPVSVEVRVVTCPWKWTDRSMHFHATWRQQRDIPTKKNNAKIHGQENAIDWNYLTVKGQGVYVGDTLALYNRAQIWWGEGDEKIYVDDEAFPSHFGTGTEDYYGYAWGKTHFFDSPFHAQPRAEGPKNFGNITNTRVRLLDAIPFTKSYRMDMEIWHWAKTSVDYAVTTYWYGRPGAKENHPPQPEEAAVSVKQNDKT